MIVRGFIRKVSDGTPVPDGTEVVFRRHVDDSLLATTVTSGGMYELVLNGSPGPYYVRAAISDEVHISSSKVVGMSGPIDIGNLPLYFRLWTDGYIVGILDQMSVFATGSGMQVTVRSGATLVKGVLYDQPGQAVLPVDAADAQPRIDTVVIEAMVPGSGADVEGRTRLVVKKGTPAASPVAPSLTQLVGGIWEHPLANITVDPGVSSIASNKVTDRRKAASVVLGDGSITTAMLADDSVTAAKMAPNSVGSAEIVDGAVTKEKLANTAKPGVMVSKGDTNITPHAVMLRFAATQFNPVHGSAGSDYATGGHPYTDIFLAAGGVTEDLLSPAVQTKLNTVGGSTGTGVLFADNNYTNQTVTSGTIASVSISLPAGDWMIETVLNTSCDASSYTDVQYTLSGTGAPSGGAQSQRVFGVLNMRMIVLTGRLNVSPTSTTTYTSTASMARQSGGTPTSFGGVIYVKAWRR